MQGAYAHDPSFHQQQRRTGARSFVRSTAEQDDVAIARDIYVARLQVFERNCKAPGTESASLSSRVRTSTTTTSSPASSLAFNSLAVMRSIASFLRNRRHCIN